MLLCAALGACRESPVLQETLYLSAQEEIDEEQEELDPEDEGEEDEQFENEDEENAETQREEEEDLGLTGEEDEASNAAGVEYSATSGHDWEAAASDMDAAQNGEGGVDSSDPTVTEETDGEEVSPENAADADLETGKQVVDGAGRTVTLPENVETVTAVRWAAQMVEMLGGGGRLIAADSDFVSSDLASAVFSDLSGVRPLWTGDGSGVYFRQQFCAAVGTGTRRLF